MANIQRLRAVVDAIEKNQNPKLHFNMRNWLVEVASEEDAATFNANKEDEEEEIKCGTTMCLAGWAATVAELPVKRVRRQYSYDWDNELHIFDGYNVITPEGDRYIEYWAREYFDFDREEASQILMAFTVSTVDELKLHIEDVLGMKIWSE